MLVVMRTGDNAPTEEQVEVTNPELKRLISTETYLEEESAMDKQVTEQNTPNFVPLSHRLGAGSCGRVSTQH